MNLTSVPSQPCHPRRVETDNKILDATLRLYGECGWSSFNLTNVAAEAKIGKSALYSRWPTKDALLPAAFLNKIRVPEVLPIDVRTMLISEAEYRLNLYFGEYGKAVRRVQIDAFSSQAPALATVNEYLFGQRKRVLHDELWELKLSGKIPSEMSITRLLDAVSGSVLMRSIELAKENVECFIGKIPRYAAEIVDDQLTVLHHDSHERMLRIVS
ncbi:TetR/AcrR family transcriptional regulator [Arcanobacterium ihumii]|uniref:TetR/AcrR family transcriptional regulator n=1 Tax=Arcanobacterium ihumii TaxID=2138162 RepID=UPI000F547E7B|nr:TetR/AcrR family transcriptional regulator [Arcanobacterium ihumii]